MPFTALKLHPSLLGGSRNWASPGRRRSRRTRFRRASRAATCSACAMTGSGKTAAFLLPILHRLIGKPRGTTRALVLTPTRELAAQIVEDLNELAVHTPITGAAVFGGVGMGPQEHAFRSGVDVIVATPGRLLDHLRVAVREVRRARGARARRGGPHARHGLPAGHPPHPQAPARRSGRRCSSARRCRRRSWRWRSEMLHNPVTISLERQGGAGRRHHAGGVPGAAGAEVGAAARAAGARRHAGGARLHAHEAPREPAGRVPGRARASTPSASTATARRRSAPRRSPASRAGKYRVLVATDIAARGIDVEALGHVVNFDVPKVARRLHPPRRPHGARRGDGRRVHVRLAGGGSGPARHRAGDRQAPAARHRARLRLHGAARSRSSRSRSPSASRPSAR